MTNDQTPDKPVPDKLLDSAAHSTSLKSIGAELRAQREAKGWEIEQVASQLKLAPRQVHAIEADNYSMLPGMVVVRGFVRSYAKLLKIDAAPLVARMSLDQPGLSSASHATRSFATPFKPTAIGVNNGRNTSLVVAALGIGGAVVAVATVLYLNAGLFDRLAHSLKEGLASVADKFSTSTPPRADQGGDASETAQPVIAALPPTGQPNGDSTMVETVVAAPDGIASLPSEPPVSAPVPAPSPNNILQLKIKANSWIEVKKIDSGEILAARLVPAGTLETFEIDAPVALTIGNVAGVDASFRGAAVALNSNSSSNVARITLK